jgi:hypothetical protein
VSQITKGLILGSPGVIGSAAIVDLYGAGSPLTNPDPNIAGAQVGSTYRDYVGGTFWFRTLSSWQQVSIP